MGEGLRFNGRNLFLPLSRFSSFIGYDNWMQLVKTGDNEMLKTKETDKALNLRQTF